jgi:hypothetical protein
MNIVWGIILAVALLGIWYMFRSGSMSTPTPTGAGAGVVVVGGGLAA